MLIRTPVHFLCCWLYVLVLDHGHGMPLDDCGLHVPVDVKRIKSSGTPQTGDRKLHLCAD